MESHFHANLNIHGPAVFDCGFKSPLLNGFNGLGVQAVTEAANNADITGAAVIVDDQPQDACPLRLGGARFFRVFGIGSRNCLWSRYSATNFKDSTTDAASRT
jgi:hypothetical protein